MSELQSTGKFARGTVRQTAELAKGERREWLVKLAEVMTDVLQTSRLYTHFEVLSGNHCSVVFHDGNKALLGETVRNWLSGRFAEDDGFDDDEDEEEELSTAAFVWCEKIDNEYGLVGVIGREVVTDEITNERSIKNAMLQAQRAVQQGSAHPHIFLHGVSAADVGLPESTENVESLPIALWDALDEDEIVRLQPYEKVLSQLSLRRRIIILGVSAAAALAAFGLLLNFYVIRPAMEKWEEFRQASAPPIVQEVNYIELYQDAARAPDAALLLATLYKHYAQLMNRAFIVHVEVNTIDWEADGEQMLRIGIGPPAGLNADETQGLMGYIRKQAMRLGYKVEGTGRIVLAIPVRVPARSVEIQQQIFFQPAVEPETLRRVREYIEALGGEGVAEITFSERASLNNEIFAEQPFSIQVQDLPLTANLMHTLVLPVAGTNANLSSLSLRMAAGRVEAGSLNFTEYKKAAAPETTASAGG